MKIRNIINNMLQSYKGGNKNLHTNLEGRYTLTKIKPDGSSSIVAEFPNLITNIGLDRMGTDIDFLNYIYLGTGSATPNFTDTAMSVFKAASNTASVGDNVHIAASVSPYYCQVNIVKRFAAGVATGNLTEVGVGWSNTGESNSIFSRALILDNGANPTSISLLDDEILDVTYTLRWYIPLTDVNATLSGYTTKIRAANATSTEYYNGWGFNPFSHITTFRISDTDVLANIDSMEYSYEISPIYTYTPYTAGSHSRTVNVTIPLDLGNYLGGVGSVAIKHGLGFYQVSFTPKILKDDTKSLSLTFTSSWGRL